MTWTSVIPLEKKGNSLKLRRTPAKGKLTGIVTSVDLLGHKTHYWHGRTMPCEEHGCEACEEGAGFRWHFYTGIFSQKFGGHFIFECTGNAAEGFAIYRTLTATLRGAYFEAERTGCRPNSPVIVRCKPCDLTGIALPDPPDIKRILAMIWGLPASAIVPDGAIRGTPIAAIASDVLDLERGALATAERKKRAITA